MTKRTFPAPLLAALFLALLSATSFASGTVTFQNCDFVTEGTPQANKNDWSEVNPPTIADKPATTSATGWRFISWNNALSGSEVIDNDLTITPICLELYLVTFKQEDGTTISVNDKVLRGSSPTQPGPTDKKATGFDHDGWNITPTGASLTNVTVNNIVATAKYKTRQYTVSFYNNTAANNGTIIETTQTVDHNAAATPPAIPSVPASETDADQKEFKTWVSIPAGISPTAIANATTNVIRFDATYDYTTYSITYNLDGGAWTTQPTLTTYQYGGTGGSAEAAITLPTTGMSKIGYTFAGWLEGATIVTDIPKNATGNKSYTAKWNIVTKKITIKLTAPTETSYPGFTAISNHSDGDKLFERGYDVTTTAFTLPKPTKTGSTFVGWTKENETVKNTTVTINPAGVEPTDVTYKANFVTGTDITLYNITYNCGTGITCTVNPASSEVNSEQKTIDALPTPTRPGYDFKGWFKEAALTTQVYDEQGASGITGGTTGTETNFEAAATIYAKWEPKTITITLDYAKTTGTITVGGVAISHTAGVQTITDKNVESPNFALPTPAHSSGESFNGWQKCDDATCANPTGLVPTVTIARGSLTENVKYQAVWLGAGEYLVTFDLNYANSPEPGGQATNSSGVLASLPAPTRQGYRLEGWYDNRFGTGTKVATSKVYTENTTLYAQWTATTPVVKPATPANTFSIVVNSQNLQIVGANKAMPLSIYNMQGKLMLTRTAMPNESISVAHLPKGVYIVRAGSKTAKFAR